MGAYRESAAALALIWPVVRMQQCVHLQRGLTASCCFLVHFIPTKTAEMWMISRISKKWKCYPIHAVHETLTHLVSDNLLSFHALTGCDTTSAFSGHGKKSCWKPFQNQPLLVKGTGCDGESSSLPVWHITMPSSNPYVRPKWVWRCYLQPKIPWNFTLHVPTTKERSGSRHTRNI